MEGMLQTSASNAQQVVLVPARHGKTMQYVHLRTKLLEDSFEIWTAAHMKHLVPANALASRKLPISFRVCIYLYIRKVEKT